MSLNPRDLTQGGQVAFMRLKMFLQINNLISYYVIMGTVLFGLAVAADAYEYSESDQRHYLLVCPGHVAFY
ncbi:hypothetical protein QWI30_00450 [Citrobacter freundii]|nr:hypothetical protein [Citrobacter freundii]